jgi:8-oxo-dGTP pyrophosphatase MutT (NUDIX family)
VGWLTPERAARLAGFPRVFRVNSDRVAFVPALADERSRSAAMADVARTLAAEGALSAWRDERYAVAPGLDAPPWFLLERAAARYFGVHTCAAHVNGLVRDGGGIRTWLARRSPTKAIDPSQLDNLVGGGVAAGNDVAQTVVKEAWEEAGIDAALAATAVRTGTVGIRRLQPDGLQRETIHVHDLWLPPSFVPRNQDGEAVEHRQVSLAQAARLCANDAGPDVVTADASLVILDALLRLGTIGDDAPHRAELAALLGRERLH